jgi:NAD-dependent SIR2 family protein deacetylase
MKEKIKDFTPCTICGETAKTQQEQWNKISDPLADKICSCIGCAEVLRGMLAWYEEKCKKEDGTKKRDRTKEGGTTKRRARDHNNYRLRRRKSS